MKIDVTRIEGYDDMTLEDKVAMLEGYDIPEPDMSGYVKKETFDKAASETAEWKRKYNSLLSEEEQRTVARDEELQELRREVEEGRIERQVAEIKTQYLEVGYDGEMAEEIARATVAGEHGKVFQIHKRFLDARDKKVEAELIARTPRPTGAGVSTSPKPMTKEEIVAIKDPEERHRKIRENLEEFEN